VVATARRTGRAELDEHAQDVNASEIDVGLEMKGRSKEELLTALRRALSGRARDADHDRPADLAPSTTCCRAPGRTSR
jgi:hypothetical protein